MLYDFDKPVERRGTYSAKWDGIPLFSAAGISERGDADTLPLFTADMDFPCPQSVKTEILKAAEHNLYGYTTLHPAMGGPYYEAVVNWFRRRHGWEIRPEEILYVDGTITAVRHAVLAFSGPGDGILINRPIYTPFTKIIEGAGRQVINSPLVNTNGYYTIDFEDFERKAALPSTACCILCSPHNPTGRIWTDEELTRMQMLEMCQERKKQKSSLMLTRKERIAACVAELQKLGQRQERYKQEKFRAYENFNAGELTKDAYLKQRAEIDSKIASAKAEQDKQEQLLSELERLAVQDKAQEDDVFLSYAGATELTAELAGTFIKEILVSSPTEIEIVWKFRDVFGMLGNDNG